MPKRPSLAIVQNRQRIIAAFATQCCIMKLVPAHDRAGPADRTVTKKARFAIAEMELACRKAGRMSEKASHRVMLALPILEALTEHHVATALAVHPTGLRKPR